MGLVISCCFFLLMMCSMSDKVGMVRQFGLCVEKCALSAYVTCVEVLMSKVVPASRSELNWFHISAICSEVVAVVCLY